MTAQAARETMASDVLTLLQEAHSTKLNPFQLNRIKNDIEKLRQIDPATAYGFQSEYQLILGNEEEALQDVDNAIRLGLGNSEFLNEKAFILIALGRYGEAFDALEKGLELAPANRLVWNNFLVLAFILNDMERYQKGMALYQEIFREDFVLPGAGFAFNKGNQIFVLIRQTNKLVFKKPLTLVSRYDADTGKYITGCEDFPMLSGFGETAETSAYMWITLVDELYDTLTEQEDFSEELRRFKPEFLDMIEHLIIKVPNTKTLAAMAEAEAGNLDASNSVEELMADLNADEDKNL